MRLMLSAPCFMCMSIFNEHILKGRQYSTVRHKSLIGLGFLICKVVIMVTASRVLSER